MLVCLKRENINGAENSLYHDLSGNDVLMDDFILDEGKALLWLDNKVYHYVKPASLADREKEGVRTMVLVHCPGIMLLTGDPNKNNTLQRLQFEESRQLRKAANLRCEKDHCVQRHHKEQSMMFQ